MAAAPSLAIDGEGRPGIAWTEPSGDRMRIVVHRWTGAEWATTLLAGLAAVNWCAPFSMPVYLTLDPKGKPYVSFADGRAIDLFAWNGSRFTDLATFVPHQDAAFTQPLWVSFDKTGIPYFAYTSQIVQGSKRVDRVSVSFDDPKVVGFRDLPHPADRPLEGQILAFRGGDNPAIALIDALGPDAEVRVVSWENGLPKERTGERGQGQWHRPTGTVWPSVALPVGAAAPMLVHRAAAIGDTAILAEEWTPTGFRLLGGSQMSSEGIGTGVQEGAGPSIAMRDGNIAVAFRRALPSPTVEVRRYASCGWETLPAFSPDSMDPPPQDAPIVALDKALRPIVAWSAASGQSAVFRFDGTNWEALHSPRARSLPGGWTARQPSLFGLVTDGVGAPVVGFLDWSNGGVTVARFDSSKSAFVDLEAHREPGGGGTLPGMAVDASGQILFAMLEWKDRSAFLVHVRRREADRWVDLPPWTSPPTPNSGFHPERLSLAADGSGNVAVGFRWSAAEAPWMALWNGTSWKTISSPGMDGLGPGGPPSLAFDGASGLHVAWSDRATGEVYVKRYAAGAWADVEGSGRGPGLSASEARSVDPALGASGGVLCAAWSENEAGVNDGRVLLRCHHDSATP